MHLCIFIILINIIDTAAGGMGYPLSNSQLLLGELYKCMAAVINYTNMYIYNYIYIGVAVLNIINTKHDQLDNKIIYYYDPTFKHCT